MAQLSIVPPFTAGSVFFSRSDVLSARDALHASTGYKLVSSDTNAKRMIFECQQRKGGCPVKVRVNFSDKKGFWKISNKAILNHTCSPENHSLPNMKTAQLGKALVARVRTEYEKLPSGPDLVSMMKAEHGRTISMKTAYRGLQCARNLVFGSEEYGFSVLESYLEELVTVNPGSSKYFEKDQAGRFVRAGYVAPYAAQFLKNGIPCIITDMAHFRKSKYPGMSPTIVAMDCENHILPLSWGTAGAENEEEYAVFFQHFVNTIEVQDPQLNIKEDFNKMGDRDKGQQNAGNRILGTAKQSTCLKHFEDNIANNFARVGDTRAKFRTAASFFTKQEADLILSEIQTDYPDIYNFICDAGLHNFCRSYTDHPRYGVLTSQAVESWQRTTKKWRSLPRLPYFQKVQHKAMCIIEKRRQQIAKAKETPPQHGAVPSALAQITESWSQSSHYECSKISDTVFVCYMPQSASQWIVNFETNSCRCGRFSEMGMACVHAIAAIRKFHPCLIKDTLHRCHLMENWEAAYAISILPVVTEFQVRDCLPPVFKRGRGRPRGTRIRNKAEVRDILARARPCRQCGVLGHKASQCNNAQPPTIVVAPNMTMNPVTGELQL